jgi:cytochrome c oxidase subunit 2
MADGSAPVATLAVCALSRMDCQLSKNSYSRGVFMKSKSILLVLCIGMIAAGVLSSRIVRAQEALRRIDITVKRFAFTPDEITLKKGLRFRDLNLNVKIDKGESAELKFTPDKTGDFVGHCSVFCGSGHGAMTLTLHVVD